jgi:hypothetical protein
MNTASPSPALHRVYHGTGRFTKGECGNNHSAGNHPPVEAAQRVLAARGATQVLVELLVFLHDRVELP